MVSACVREGRRERQEILVGEGQASEVQEGQLPKFEPWRHMIYLCWNITYLYTILILQII